MALKVQRHKRNLFKVLVALLVTMTLLATGCSNDESNGTQGEKEYITMVTGSSGGVYYMLGAGICQLVEKYNPGVQATAIASTNIMQNYKEVGKIKETLGIGGTDSGYAAYRGERGFEVLDKLRWVVKGAPSWFHIVVLEDSPYQKVEDLKGKKIASYPGASSEFQTPHILEPYGLFPGKNYVNVPLAINEAVAALKDGQIDAIVQTAGVPIAQVTDLATTKGIRLLPISPDKQEEICNKHPYYTKEIIKAGSYPGVDEDIATVAITQCIFTNADVSEELVYKITKTIVEHTEELGKIHPLGYYYDLEDAIDGAEEIMPVHPGALKYYEEKGLVE